MMKERSIVVIPTYNECDNLERLTRRVLGQSVSLEVLIVDDCSPDGTGDLADRLAAQHPAFHVLHRESKDGLGHAYRAGFRWALERDYDFVFQMDGDFSHDADDLPRFLDAAASADLVLGSRYQNGIRVINWPLKRLILSVCAAHYVRVVTGMPFTDPTGGFKCFRREALASIDLNRIQSNGYSFQIEMTHQLWRHGMRIVEVPIVFTERVEGCSKMSGPIVSEAVWMVWKLLLRNRLRRRPASAVSYPIETSTGIEVKKVRKSGE